LQEKDAAGLRGLLVNVGEAVRTVASEEFEPEERVVGNFLLPADAGNCKTRLLKAASGKKELANDGALHDDLAGGVVKGVELLLIESLADEREIKRGVVDAPANGNF